MSPLTKDRHKRFAVTFANDRPLSAVFPRDVPTFDVISDGAKVEPIDRTKVDAARLKRRLAS